MLLKGDYYSPKYADKESSFYVLPQIIVKTKNENLVDVILRKYNDKLKKGEDYILDMYKLPCYHVDNAEEVLRMVEDISTMDDVEWCEPNKYVQLIML